jgi:hypothetical protein
MANKMTRMHEKWLLIDQAWAWPMFTDRKLCVFASGFGWVAERRDYLDLALDEGRG